MSALILPAANLAILIGAIWWFGRKPLAEMVSARHAKLKADIEDTRKELARAQSEFEEYGAKLHVVEQEIQARKDEAKRSAEAARGRILAESNKLAATIVSDAQLVGGGIWNDLRGQARAELARQVLERAETMLQSRLTGEERSRIRQEFSLAVERNR